MDSDLRQIIVERVATARSEADLNQVQLQYLRQRRGQ